MPDDKYALLGDIRPQQDYRFASGMAKALPARADGNIVFSPAGLCKALAMPMEGMRYDSRRMIRDIIGEPWYYIGYIGVTMRPGRPFGFAIKGLSWEGLLLMGVVRKM